MRDLSGQNYRVLEGSQARHDYAVSGLSGVLGSRWNFNESYAVFRRSGEQVNRGTPWNNCAISQDSAVTHNMCLSLMSA